MKIVEREIKDTKGCDERRHVSCLTSPVVSRLTSHAPAPWPKVKLGEIGRVAMCKRVLNRETADTGEIPFFKIGTFGKKANAFITRDKFEYYRTHYSYPQKGNVLISAAGTIGRLVVFNGEPAYFQDSNIVWLEHDGQRLCDKYLYYFLLGHEWQFTQGATIQRLYNDDIRSTEIPLPPLPVQRRIADILSAYDDLIENNRRRIAILEETARLAYRKWFVERHFPGHECVSIEDGIPHGWEKVHLGDCVVTNLQSYRATELPSQINYIDISSVKEGRVLEKKHLCSHEAPGRARRIARSGDVIWSNVRPNLKSYALILEPEADDVFSTGFTILTPKSIPYSFLYFFVSTDEFVSYLDNMVTGATYPAVRPGDFEQAELLLPNRELLTRFHTLFEPLLWQCEALVRQNAALTTARDMLLPRLMKGEVNL